MLPVITKIYNKSDFTVQLPLAYNYDGQEFRFTIYTCGEIENGWVASYIDGVYTNCSVENDIVTIYVNNNNQMNPGCVAVQSEYDYSNHHFVDNEDNVKDNYKTNIYLVNYETNAFSAQFRPSNLPDLTGSEDFVTYSYLSSTLEDYVQEGELDEYITEEDLSYELSNYITDEELTDMGFLTQSEIDQMGYATVAYLNEKLSSKQNLLISGQNIKTINGYSLLGSGNIDITDAGSIDLSYYVTYDFLSSQSYVTQSQLSSNSYVTQNELQSQLSTAAYVTQSQLDQAGYITSSDISDFVTEQDVQNILVECGYITSNELSQMSYINTQYLDQASYTTLQEVSQQGFTTANDFKTINGYSIVGSGNIEITSGGTVDLSSYVTKDELSAAGYITSIPSDYATYDAIDQMGYVSQTQLNESSYVTTSDLNTELGDYPTNNDLALTLQDYVSYSQFNTYTSDFVVDSDLENFVTYDYLEGQGYITTIPNNYATYDAISQMGYITLNDVPVVDLSSYVTKTELSNAGYLTSIPSDYATYDAISEMGYLTSIPSEYVTESQLQSTLTAYVTESELSSMGYITSIPSDYATYDAISQIGYVTDTALQSQLQQAGYITSSALSGLATETYVADYVAEHAPMPDLSSYVTKTELSNAGYVTNTSLQSQLQQAGYLTSIPNNYATYDAISQMGYLTSIPSDYITESELNSMSYVSHNELSSMGYLTEHQSLRSYLSVANWTTGDYDIQLRKNGLTMISTTHTIAPAEITYANIDSSSNSNAWIGLTTLKNYVNGRLAQIEATYITSADIPTIPVIDESIIPNTTLTYTLGDINHFYDAAYINRVNGPDAGMSFRLGNTGKVALYNATFRPASNDNMLLGTANQKWSTTYSYHYYQNDKDISDIYTQAYVLTQNQYDGLTQADKDKETIYIISDQQAYMNNELVTETSLDSRGFLTAANFNYDPTTGTLTLNL